MQGNCCRLRQTLPYITHDTGPKITPSRRTQPEKNETFVVAVWSRAAEQAACRVATTRRLARPLARRLRSEPRNRSQPAGRHASAVSSECALRLCLASSVACASEFKPLARPECEREREQEPRERGPVLRVPVCVCAVIALGVPLLASSDQRNGHL